MSTRKTLNRPTSKEDFSVENTHEFVEKMKSNAEKARHNKENHGKGSPNSKLPTKQHGTNK